MHYYEGHGLTYAFLVHHDSSTQKRPPAISLFYKRRAFQKHVICEKNHSGGNCISLNVFEAFSKFCKSLESFNSITLLFLNAEHDLSIKFSA